MLLIGKESIIWKLPTSENKNSFKWDKTLAIVLGIVDGVLATYQGVISDPSFQGALGGITWLGVAIASYAFAFLFADYIG